MPPFTENPFLRLLNSNVAQLRVVGVGAAEIRAVETSSSPPGRAPHPRSGVAFPSSAPSSAPPPQASEAQGERGMMNLSAGLHRALTQPRATERSVGDSADLFQTLLIFGGSKGTRVISS